MKKCDFDQELYLLRDVEISSQDKSRIETHLQGCMSCTQKWEAWGSVSHHLREFKPKIESLFMSNQIMHSIKQSQREGPSLLAWLKLRPALYTAIVVVLIILGVFESRLVWNSWDNTNVIAENEESLNQWLLEEEILNDDVLLAFTLEVTDDY